MKLLTIACSALLFGMMAQASTMAKPVNYTTVMKCSSHAMDADVLSIVKDQKSGQLYLSALSTWTFKTAYIPMVLIHTGGGLIQYKAASATISMNDLAPTQASITGFGPDYACSTNSK